jgi:hypothetical protein
MLQSSSPQTTETTESAQLEQARQPEQLDTIHAEQQEQTAQLAHAAQMEQRLTILAIGLTVIETLLVTLALVPAQFWTRLLPNVTSAALDGPFPPSVAPIITVLLYIIPAIIGLLNRSWQRALLLATLPAWFGLGAFLVAATFKVGAFYMVSVDRVTANVSVLELFAALGALGWLARTIFKWK